MNNLYEKEVRYRLSDSHIEPLQPWQVVWLCWQQPANHLTLFSILSMAYQKRSGSFAVIGKLVILDVFYKDSSDQDAYDSADRGIMNVYIYLSLFSDRREHFCIYCSFCLADCYEKP